MDLFPGFTVCIITEISYHMYILKLKFCIVFFLSFPFICIVFAFRVGQVPGIYFGGGDSLGTHGESGGGHGCTVS